MRDTPSVLENPDGELADNIVAEVRRFVNEKVIPVATEYEHADKYPDELVRSMKSLGLFGMT